MYTKLPLRTIEYFKEHPCLRVAALPGVVCQFYKTRYSLRDIWKFVFNSIHKIVSYPLLTNSEWLIYRLVFIFIFHAALNLFCQISIFRYRILFEESHHFLTLIVNQ